VQGVEYRLAEFLAQAFKDGLAFNQRFFPEVTSIQVENITNK